MARNASISIDGYTSTDQGGAFPVKSRGSKKVVCDLSSEVNWWGVRLIEHFDPVPLDKQGRPMRLCSGGHYAPRDTFRKDRTRKDGLDYYCSGCRKTQAHIHQMTVAKVK